MRTATAALVSFLISRRPCFKADLFTVTLADGTIYRWTDFDQDIPFDYLTWSAQGPLISRTAIGVKNTIEVPEMTIKLSALDTTFVGGANIKLQLHNGAFDGAIIDLDRVFMPTPLDTSLGVVRLFSGRMSKATITAVGAELSVKGLNVLMNQQTPRNVYRTGCLHAFCDPNCTLLKATYTTTNTAGSGTTKNLVKWGTPVGSPGLYTQGTITMTSGVATGQTRTIKFADVNGIVPTYPFYATPNPGDTFFIFQGCDKTLDSGSGRSCTDRANTQHYRGFDYIPPAETAV